MYVKPNYAVLSKASLKQPYGTICDKEYCPSTGYTSCAFLYW